MLKLTEISALACFALVCALKWSGVEQVCGEFCPYLHKFWRAFSLVIRGEKLDLYQTFAFFLTQLFAYQRFITLSTWKSVGVLVW